MITEVASLRPNTHASATCTGVEWSRIAIFRNSTTMGSAFSGSIGGKFSLARRPVSVAASRGVFAAQVDAHSGLAIECANIDAG
jgi:hypothetical protein